MTVLLLAAWLMPNEALCYEQDPYLRKSIVGRVYLVYATLDTTSGGQQYSSSRFQQTYSLDTKGNLLSRNIIIYDAGATWNLNDYNNNSSTTNSKSTRYYARTTILPRSAIPLTLHWSTDTNSTSTSATQSVNKIYGLDWSGKFRTLPTTKISAETAENNSSYSQTRTNRYSLDMEKALGPTKNHLNFKEENTRIAPSGDSTDQYSLNIDNKTRIGRSTDLTAGFTKSETAGSAPGIGSTMQGISLLLNSKPSDEFTQTHSYNFFNNKSVGNIQEGTTYAGSLSYDVGRAFNSNISLNINNAKSDSPTSKTRDDNLLSKAFVRFTLSTHWFVSQQITIDNSKANSSVSTVNLNTHSIFKSLTALNYKRPLKWAVLSAHYGAGYTKETYTQQPSGKGLLQDAAVALKNINITKYAGFNTSAGLTRVEKSASHANSSSEYYNLNGFNKVGRKYAAVTANYSRSYTKSWNSLYDSNRTHYDLAANSTYYKYTTLGYSMANTSSFNSIHGVAKSASKNFSLGYKRPLFSGNFISTLAYGTSNAVALGGVSASNTKSATAGYERTIFKGSFSSFLDYSSTHSTSQSIFEDRIIQGIRLSYGRKVFSGDLSLSYHTSTQNRATQSQQYSTTLTDYNIKYSTILFRRLSWKAYYSVKKSESDFKNYGTTVTNYSNALAYRLRRWSLTAEQSHRLTQTQSGLDITENKLLLTAERTFVRIF